MRFVELVNQVHEVWRILKQVLGALGRFVVEHGPESVHATHAAEALLGFAVKLLPNGVWHLPIHVIAVPIGMAALALAV